MSARVQIGLATIIMVITWGSFCTFAFLNNGRELSHDQLLWVAVPPILGGVYLVFIGKHLDNFRRVEVQQRTDQLLAGGTVDADRLGEQLEAAVEQLNKASAAVGVIVGEMERVVEERQHDVVRIQTVISELKKEYDLNKSLTDLTAEQAEAVRKVWATEIAVVTRRSLRSYIPDLLINAGVGLIFFVLGLIVASGR